MVDSNEAVTKEVSSTLYITRDFFFLMIFKILDPDSSKDYVYSHPGSCTGMFMKKGG